MIAMTFRDMPVAGLVAAAVICILLYFGLQVWNAATYWKVRRVKHFTPWPIIGNMARVAMLRKHITYYYDELYKAFPAERMVGMYEFLTPTLILRDPELVEQVLVKEFSIFPDRGDLFVEPSSVLSESVFFIKGNRWRAIRNKLLTCFTTRKMKAIFPDLVEECQTAISKDPKILNKDFFHSFTIKSFMKAMFGFEIRPEGEKELLSNCYKLLEPNTLRIYQQVFLTYFAKTSAFFNLKFMPKSMDNYFRDLLNTLLDQAEKTGHTRDDFTQVLCELKKMRNMNVYNRGNNKIDETFNVTNDMVLAQAFLFFFAGLDATYLAMLHLAYELSLAKGCQEMARQEVRSVLKKHGGYSWEAIREMKYLEQCIQETLRKHPSIQFMARVAEKGTVLDGVGIEKGTRVVIPLHSMHMDPRYFPDPEVFDPERYNDPPRKFTHMAFGDGPRVCIGKRFATMEIATLLAHILDNFELSPSPTTKLPLVYEPKTLLHVPVQDNEICVIATKI